MGDSRPRIPYSVEYIETLRKDVLQAYFHFEKKVKLIANKTRDSDGYKILKKLLDNKTKKVISPSAIVEFFTKEPDIERDGLVLNYETYTVEGFEKLVQIFKDEATFSKENNSEENPQNHSNEDGDKAVRSLLHELYLRNKSISSIETKVVIEEDGTSVNTVYVFIKALNDIANVRLNAFNAKGLKVKWVEAYESLTKEKLPLFPFEINENCYYAYIMFPKILEKNTHYYYTYSICVENDYQDLIDEKVKIDERYIKAKKYKSIVEEYFFPDTDTFKKLRLTIASHCDPLLSNKEVFPVVKDGHKIFRVDHGELKKVTDAPIKLQWQID